MRKQTMMAAGLGAVLTVLLVTVLVAVSREQPAPDTVDAAELENSAVLRPDSHVLGEKGNTGVTFVEFLDFECEACAAAFPLVEALREQYAGRVTFVARYFPLDGHFNAERAARAVESAARQDRFEEMYQKMYTTQSSWGEQQTPKDDLFRSFAQELGLDMDRYDRDYASESVADRVARDVKDGESLGIQGTPTFYLDGAPVQPESPADLQNALDQALAKAQSE